ncbi:MAG TPA: FHA domain-containing protein [Vicinamibacterales bacterium]
MARLIVKLGERDLQEYDIGAQPIAIGRLPDNQIVIDNPTVSGHHARVHREGAICVLEDLKSTNGTFVHGKPIARHSLREGDVVLIGKHALLFTRQGDPPDDLPADSLEASGGAMDSPPQIYDDVVPKTAIPTAHGSIGIVTVIAGDTGQSQYMLTAMTTVIGKSDMAEIRVKGWLKPQMAAAIARKGEGFAISPMEGKVSVNGQRITNRRDLASGDVIETSGLTLEFTLKA